jgi:hypothetical protein
MLWNKEKYLSPAENRTVDVQPVSVPTELSRFLLERVQNSKLKKEELRKWKFCDEEWNSYFMFEQIRTSVRILRYQNAPPPQVKS